MHGRCWSCIGWKFGHRGIYRYWSQPTNLEIRVSDCMEFEVGIWKHSMAKQVIWTILQIVLTVSVFKISPTMPKIPGTQTLRRLHRATREFVINSMYM